MPCQNMALPLRFRFSNPLTLSRVASSHCVICFSPDHVWYASSSTDTRTGLARRVRPAGRRPP
jgi:hypothetical protein